MVEHKTLAHALAAARVEFPTIEKDSVNPHFRNRYADLASILKAVVPVLSRHGLALTQPTLFEDGQLLLRTELIHAATGDIIASVYPVQPSKPDPQGVGSALTYARRYSLTSLLAIAADDDDDGHQASQPPRQQQQQRPPERQPERQPAPAGDEFLMWIERAAQKLRNMDQSELVGHLAKSIGFTSHNGDPWAFVRGAWGNADERLDLIEECRRLAGTKPETAGA
jgi:hypothetical protein